MRERMQVFNQVFFQENVGPPWLSRANVTGLGTLPEGLGMHMQKRGGLWERVRLHTACSLFTLFDALSRYADQLH